MKVLLINPPYPISEHPTLPVSLMSLATYLKQEGIDVNVLDLLLTCYSKSKIEEKLNSFKPHVVGTTSVTMNFHEASRILQHCKEVNPDIITVIGGPHVTFTPRETLQKSPWIDFVVRGEGERTFIEIIRHLEKGNTQNLANILGLAFLRENEVIITPPRSLMADIHSLPKPTSSLFPIARYRALDTGYSVTTSRGCPFNCIFCVGTKMSGKKGRFKDPVKVTDEIEEGYKYGFNSICIEDDLFTLNRNHVHTICDEIIRRKLDISLHVFARVDTVDKLLLEKMKEAGCSLIVFGVESGSQKILDIIKKKTDLQKIRHAVALTKEVGIDVLASFILGLPGETKETLKITTEFAKELDTYYGFHILAPFPGTEVREKAEELGLKILSHNWKHYNADIPITETDDAKREDVYYYLNQYNRAVDSYNKHQDTSASNGTLDESELQEVEKRHQKHFAWELLTKDLVEKLGQIEYADTNLNTKESLTTFKNKLVNHMPFSENFIEQGLQKLIQQGLLVHQSKGNNSVWRWSSNEELLSHSPDDIADLESAASYPPDIRSENTERVYLYRTKI